MSNNIKSFLIALKNASTLKKKTVEIKKSKQVSKIIHLLYKHNYILSYTTNNISIVVFLNNNTTIDVFKTLTLFSDTFRSNNIKYVDLCRLIYKHKELVLSTPFGYLTGKSCKERKIGGKLLFLL